MTAFIMTENFNTIYFHSIIILFFILFCRQSL